MANALSRSIVLALSTVLSLPAVAFAADDMQPKRQDTWEVGARVNGFTADPFMDYFYEKHESVTGYTVGAFLSRHSAGGNRIQLGLAYSSTEPKDGPWLENGKELPSSEYTKFRSFRILEAHVLIGKEWTFGPFGFFTGAGFGVALPSGTITSYETVPPDFENENPASLPDEKDVPPAVPTVIVRIGPTVHLGPMVTLYGDVGIQNGFYGGAGVGVKF